MEGFPGSYMHSLFQNVGAGKQPCILYWIPNGCLGLLFLDPPYCCSFIVISAVLDAGPGLRAVTLQTVLL
jgi:hypothetical protein